MSGGSLGITNPLSYMGVTSRNPPQLIVKDFAPTVNDIENFQIGALWIDQPNDDVYMLVDKASGQATWTYLGGAADTVETITTPDSTVVVPDNHNINFLNGDGAAITGSGDDITFATTDIDTITTPDLNTVTPTAKNVNFVNGDGIDITGSGDSVTFTVTQSPLDIQWEVVTGATQNMEDHKGYFANNAGGVAFTLPATSAVGDTFHVSSINAGGWSVLQNAGQTIRFGNSTTTTGVGGSLASTAIGDSIAFVCSVVDTDFVIINSVGNITVT